MRGLKLYEVNPNYIKYLAQYQEHIFISDGDKASRKYIGILLQINDIKYFDVHKSVFSLSIDTNILHHSASNKLIVLK